MMDGFIFGLLQEEKMGFFCSVLSLPLFAFPHHVRVGAIFLVYYLSNKVTQV
jgi:hypothetical protein